MTVELFQDVLNIEPVDPNKDYLPELVGEGKKYKDQAALARSRVEADRHIQRLEAEKKAMLNDLNSRLSMEELVTKLSSLKAPEPAPQGGEDRTQETSKNTLTAEDLARIVDERVNARSEAERAKANLGLVKNTLKQAWGDNFVDTMKQKAQELGVGENFLNSLAMDQPAAFLKLMDVGTEQKDKPKTNTSAPIMGNQIDSSKRQAQPQADPNYKGKNYYMKLHRENPSVFWNPKTQLEMDQMSQLDPEKFLAS